jgi:hypothetical protein
MKNKNVVLYGVIALVAVVAIAFFTGTIPPKSNLEGTIGGANRYQSQQISQTDVVLKDADVQAFLQSDTFHQIQTNPELAAVLSDPGVTEALKIRSFPGLLGDGNAIKAFQGLPGESYKLVIKNLPDNAAFRVKDLASDLLVRKILALASDNNVTTVAGFDNLVKQVPGSDALIRKYAPIWNDFSTMVAGNADAANLRKWLLTGDNLAIVGDDGFITAVKGGVLEHLKEMPLGWNELITQQKGGFDKLVAVDGLRIKVADLPNQ